MLGMRIVITLVSKGRLGNLLFTLAFAHSLRVSGVSEKIPIKIEYDAKAFRSDSDSIKFLNKYARVCNHVRLVKSNESIKVFRHKVFGLKSKVSTLDFLSNPHRFINPNEFHLSDVILKGYFQNYESIALGLPIVSKEVVNLIRELEIVVSKNFSKEPYSLVHVRRTDYLSEENRELGILSKEYYAESLRIFGKDSQVIVTTDELNLQSDFLPCHHRVFSSLNLSTIEALSMFLSANRVFMANSSFSWWGSMLNLYSNSYSTPLLVAPFPWFKNVDASRAIFHPAFKLSKAIHS